MASTGSKLAFPAVGSFGRWSAAMCVLVAVGGALAELALCWVWLSPDLVRSLVVPRLGMSGVPIALDGATRFAGFAIAMVPMAVLFYVLRQVFDLFDGFRRGLVLTSETAQRLRAIGSGIIVLALLRPIAAMLIGLALTISNPAGARIVSLGVSVDDYMIALLGGLLLAIGHAMAEASRIAEEHSQIV